MSSGRTDPWQATRRELTTPLPVWVELPRALRPSRVGSGRAVPLRVRAGGIDNAATVPGLLLAWHRTTTGDWFALTRFTATNRAGTAQLELTHLVPADAVRPRT